MQFGFCKERNTFGDLAEFTEQIKQRSTDAFTCILLNSRKAFDSSDFEFFLAKPENYGVRRIF